MDEIIIEYLHGYCLEKSSPKILDRIGAEKISLPQKCFRNRDIWKYRVVSLLKRK